AFRREDRACRDGGGDGELPRQQGTPRRRTDQRRHGFRQRRGLGGKMAVYTDIGEAELAAFLRQYDIGELTSYKGIAEGVENSNYMLHTTTGAYFLTLYEKRVRRDDLPFFLGLTRHLADRGVRCPVP